MGREVHVDTPREAAALVANVERGGTTQATPACPGCLAAQTEITRLKQKLAGVQGQLDRLLELRGGKGSD